MQYFICFYLLYLNHPDKKKKTVKKVYSPSKQVWVLPVLGYLRDGNNFICFTCSEDITVSKLLDFFCRWAQHNLDLRLCVWTCNIEKIMSSTVGNRPKPWVIMNQTLYAVCRTMFYLFFALYRAQIFEQIDLKLLSHKLLIFVRTWQQV